MRLLLLIVVISVLVAACGGSDDSGDADTDTGSNTTSSGTSGSTDAQNNVKQEEQSKKAADDSDEDENKDEADEEDSESDRSDGAGGTMTFSGGITASMDDPAACGKGVMGYDYQAVNSSSGSTDEFWMFQIYISNFEDTPGEYPVGSDGYKRAYLTLTDGSGTSWSSTSDSTGSVTVADDLQSGTITGTLISDGTGAEVQVSGNWVCEKE